jgi:hypothetical protein
MSDESKQEASRVKRGRVISTSSSSSGEALQNEEPLGNSGISGNSQSSVSTESPLHKLQTRVDSHVKQLRRAAFDLQSKISSIKQLVKDETALLEEVKKHKPPAEAQQQQQMQVDAGAHVGGDARVTKLLDTTRWGFKNLRKMPALKDEHNQQVLVNTLNDLNVTHAIKLHETSIEHYKKQEAECTERLKQIIPQHKAELQQYCQLLASELSNDNPFKDELRSTITKFEQTACKQLAETEAIVKIKCIESREKKAAELKKKEQVTREADLKEANILQNAQTLKEYVSSEIKKIQRVPGQSKQKSKPKSPDKKKQQQQQPRRNPKNGRKRASSQPPPTTRVDKHDAAPAAPSNQTSNRGRGRGRGSHRGRGRGRGRGGGRGQGTNGRNRGRGRGSASAAK